MLGFKHESGGDAIGEAIKNSEITGNPRNYFFINCLGILPESKGNSDLEDVGAEGVHSNNVFISSVMHEETGIVSDANNERSIELGFATISKEKVTTDAKISARETWVDNLTEDPEKNIQFMHFKVDQA